MKNPIVIESVKFLKFMSFFAGFNVSGISLFPFVIVNSKKNMKLINHETIHFYQTKECWIIGFYVLYLYYYLRNRWKQDHHTAYRYICFEVEARLHQQDFTYNYRRKKNAWKSYIN